MTPVPLLGWFLVAEHLEGLAGWVKGGRRPSRSDAVGALDAFRRARMMGSGGASPTSALPVVLAHRGLALGVPLLVGLSTGCDFSLNDDSCVWRTRCRRTFRFSSRSIKGTP